MCGVLGSAGITRGLDLSVIAHRGPDGDGLAVIGQEGVVLGHTRLAINDLSDAGRQPMVDHEMGLAVSYNGEIYNYPQLRARLERLGYRFTSTMDGEVILPLYREHGIDFLSELNGIYSIAIADSNSGELWLARDRMGVKPMFWSATEGAIVFGSEPEAVRQHAGLPAKTSPEALAQYLTFLWVPAPNTGYAGVSNLRPSEVLRWTREHGVQLRDAPHALDRPSDLVQPAVAEVDDRVGDLLGAAVGRQLLADVPIGIMASGGVDSSLVWQHASASVTHSFTTVVEDDGEEGLGHDAAAAQSLAARWGTQHVPIPVAPRADPFRPRSGDLLADPSFRLAYEIAARARSLGMKVLLSGQGADEVFGGYRRHQAAYWLEHLPSAFGRYIPSSLERLAARSVRGEYLHRLTKAASERDPFPRAMQLMSYTDAEERAMLLGADVGDVDDDVVYSEHRRVWEQMPDTWGLTKRVMQLDLEVYMPGLNLAVTDRATMAAGVETRVPFLDDELVNYALALHPRVLLSARDRKKPLQRLAAATLPESVWNRPKAGFGVPVTSLPSAGRRQLRMAKFATLCLQDGAPL